ncbi:class I SAM-dependent methyltransferase [Marinicrinis sediminis]|uniref:Class I SAM-dependent methyltransferase n=1 Tax=Marinicrinis sediminis TaxID=1652465 RepID=A0ABW5RF44_9BACL
MSQASYPTTLFNDHYHAAYRYVSDYTAYALQRMLMSHGVRLDKGASLSQIVQTLGCQPPFEGHVKWVLAFMAQQGVVWQDHEKRWIGKSLTRPVRPKTIAHVHIEPSIRLIDHVCEHWPNVINGKQRALQVLFGNTNENGESLWESYFCNSHDLYAVHNQWAAEHCASLAARMDVAKCGPRVLELGTGFGSAARALLAEYLLQGLPLRHLMLSDISPALATRVQRELQPCHEQMDITSCKLDINRIDPDLDPNYDVVLAVNVAHCASHIRESLAGLKKLLRPGGRLVLSECVRIDDTTRLHQEFIFSLLPHFSPIPSTPVLNSDPSVPCFGFLKASDWEEALKGAGYSDVQVHINEGEQVCGALITGTNK